MIHLKNPKTPHGNSFNEANVFGKGYIANLDAINVKEENRKVVKTSFIICE